ncbi:MAG: glucose-6-phosphate dehydrogenase [Dissulfurispiraceae bacterium]
MMRATGSEVIESRFLQTCDVAAEETRIDSFTMVIFGGNGDLSQRKLIPALFFLYQHLELKKGFAILAIGRTDMNVERYRSLMEGAVREYGEGLFDAATWIEFSQHLFYLSGHFEDEETFERLTEKVRQISIPTQKGTREVIYYMAVPPQSTPVIVNKLKRHALSKETFSTKVIMEKPFGRDRSSARELNKVLTDIFDENEIYRIDHYLAKEPVQNIMFFRFSNSIFEEVWNGRFVDNVQITVAEDIGIEHRGEFYEQAGVVRDIVQNHVMQLIGSIAMEPPVGFKADFVRDERIKVLRSIRPIERARIDAFTVRGQYGKGKVNGKDVVSYREESKVSPSSNTPSFFAAKFFIDNLRWAGVPFYVRTGKRMQKRVTEICLQFKQLPLRLFGRTCDTLEPNILILTIQPNEKICLRFGVKYPYANNQIYPVQMVFSYHEAFQASFYPAYERLLADCIRGDLTLFIRQDTVEAMWELVDPIIERWECNSPCNFPNYPAGTWGPPEADLLIRSAGRDWITS